MIRIENFDRPWNEVLQTMINVEFARCNVFIECIDSSREYAHIIRALEYQSSSLHARSKAQKVILSLAEFLKLDLADESTFPGFDTIWIIASDDPMWPNFRIDMSAFEGIPMPPLLDGSGRATIKDIESWMIANKAFIGITHAQTTLTFTRI